MRKTKLILGLWIPAILLLNFCYKRPFTHMGVHGQIINAQTNRPPSHAELSLWAGCDPNDACQEANNYGKTQTNEDGTFEIKSKAQTNGTEYFLLIIYRDSKGDNQGKVISVRVSKNQNLDIGIISF